MLQCTFCYKYFHPDEAYYMDHCGGVFEYCCEKCEAKRQTTQEEEE